MQRAYQASSRLLSALIALAGLVMAVAAIARGGGPLALGVVVGTLFVVLGAARLWLAWNADR